jgi:hypothetical protein
MKMLKNLLIGALITLPVMALNAGSIAGGGKGIEMRPPSVVQCCQVLINGRWFCIPC